MLAGVITGIGNSRMLNQACEIGLAPTAETAYYASIDAQYPEFWENVGDCGQYVFFTYVGLPKSLWNEKTEAFMANFEERYGTVPGGAALESYDATHMLLAAIEQARSEAGIPYGAFDLSPEILEAIQAGRIRFAVDQQQYLQGYLPVVLLTKYLETGVLPAGGIIETGPALVTVSRVAEVMRRTREGVR